jgi:hypothetical protein
MPRESTPRRRCEFVDWRSGYRCPERVKERRRKYCCIAHAIAHRPNVRRTPPNAHAATRIQTLDEALAAVQSVATDGTVPLTALRPIVASYLEGCYRRGYHAGLVRAQRNARSLRLALAKDAVESLLATRFGRAFLTGTITVDALDQLHFGRSSDSVPQGWSCELARDPLRRKDDDGA